MSENKMDETKVQEIMRELWAIVARLEKTYHQDDRKFTIDGHLLGSIGEVYAKEKFKLKLLPNSEKTHDAVDEHGEEYQIKITQRDKVGLSSKPKNLIVIQIDKDGIPNVSYNGEGEPIWNLIKHKKTKQKFISINQLKNMKAHSKQHILDNAGLQPVP